MGDDAPASEDMSIGTGVFMPVRARYLGQRCWERGAVVDAFGEGVAVGRIQWGVRQEGGGRKEWTSS